LTKIFWIFLSRYSTIIHEFKRGDHVNRIIHPIRNPARYFVTSCLSLPMDNHSLLGRFQFVFVHTTFIFEPSRISLSTIYKFLSISIPSSINTLQNPKSASVKIVAPILEHRSPIPSVRVESSLLFCYNSISVSSFLLCLFLDCEIVFCDFQLFGFDSVVR
jgi:hypothetical protein